MGAYTTRTLTQDEFKKVIETIRNGYKFNGVKHRGNSAIAAVLTLQANLGMRIGDILNMSLDSIVKDGNHYRLDVVEEKTGKKRVYLVPDEVFNYLRDYCSENGKDAHRPIFNLTERAIQKAVKAVSEYLNLEDISTHSFRKFAACRIYESSGYDIEATREFLQHSSINTTQRYIKRTRPQLEAAILASVALV